MPWQTPCSGLAIALAACTAGYAYAGAAEEPQCSAAIPQGHPLAHRQATISSLEQMPESCLKDFLVQCSDTAGERLMDLGSAGLCSMAYEALLHKGFGGSFRAMLV